ncbi:efflux RND transporter periplasmic adaptor subunit [Zavarzinia sp.]|uniref:efflux RND transporter periplasmic adaptor subunit n=1 Tax=Zavarzinia sp. TaxID=2027920 RepID=UPI0035646092
MRFASKLLRPAVTLVVVAIAVVAGLRLWNLYMDSPWTRDGRVRADIVQVAPDVAGMVIELHVKDNQPVRQGDLLFVVDKARYQLAVDRAEATVAALREQSRQREREAARRNALGSSAITAESREQATSTAAQAAAQLHQAEADLETAKLNLARTEVRAPVNGYVTNLHLNPGDYVTAGKAAFALVDSDSYYVVGYFEETKIARIHAGDSVSVRLMGFEQAVQGKVGSIARAIVDRDSTEGGDLVANVNPTFSWVRLAQRIPVRVDLGPLPDGMVLSAGMTATVVVEDRKG